MSHTSLQIQEAQLLQQDNVPCFVSRNHVNCCTTVGKTRNAWQSSVYSPPSIVVSPSSE